MNKKSLSEQDICSKFILPAILKSGWNLYSQIREQVSFTDGRIYVRGKLTKRGERKRADFILFYKPNIPLAVVEGKENNYSTRSGIQQALNYARILDIPFIFSSNGDGFLFHDKTATDENIETELGLDNFPSPEQLWEKYKKFKGIETVEAEKIIAQDYYSDGSDFKPRYYQQIAINRTVEAIAKGQNRILLVMATGTGKTYTAFQIIHRLWKSRTKKRILFLADRNALIDQTKRSEFKHFKDKMTVVKHRQIDKSYEIYLALYQGLSGNDDDSDVYKQFSPDFFDLIVIDECHRGSAKDDSSWREILTYFKNATQIGLTATPRETNEISNAQYFGEPVYTYSLKQGIDDGFLAPYKVIRFTLNVDAEGYRPEKGKTDKDGNLVEDRIYNTTDFDKKLVIDERTALVAQKITEFLKATNRLDKTIVFCADINHAERMRSALAKHNADLVAQNYKYIMQITGDNDEGKRELSNFTNKEERYPVIATTSELMTTGIDAVTCKVIVLDANINSMTKFKQIIGRGTRISEEFNKLYFTILDFKNATNLFADPDFDGDPIVVKPVTETDNLEDIIEGEWLDETPLIDNETGEEIKIEKPFIPEPFDINDNTLNEPREKIYVNGVDVSVLASRELNFDQNGKLITVTLQDHTKQILKQNFVSLENFLTKWNETERKEVIIAELQAQGILVHELYEAVDNQLDLFDLICFLAFDKPPLTRTERANNVRKRNVFSKYSAQAKKVLNGLLDKYADEGIENVESLEVLRIDPFNAIGTPTEIINFFGSRRQYVTALKELEAELYKTA